LIPNAFSKRIAMSAEIDECPFSRVLRDWRETPKCFAKSLVV
jgi:hypothetical protein